METFTKVVASASAAPISHVVPTSIARAHVATRVATDTSATRVKPTVQLDSTALAAVVHLWGNVKNVQYHRMRRTHHRVVSERIIARGSASLDILRVATRARSAPTNARQTPLAKADTRPLEAVHV